MPPAAVLMSQSGHFPVHPGLRMELHKGDRRPQHYRGRGATRAILKNGEMWAGGQYGIWMRSLTRIVLRKAAKSRDKALNVFKTLLGRGRGPVLFVN